MAEKEFIPDISFLLDRMDKDNNWKVAELQRVLKNSKIKVEIIENRDSYGVTSRKLCFNFDNYKAKKSVGGQEVKPKIQMRYSEVVKYLETHTVKSAYTMLGYTRKTFYNHMAKFIKDPDKEKRDDYV